MISSKKIKKQRLSALVQENRVDTIQKEAVAAIFLRTQALFLHTCYTLGMIFF
jgi:hypothetical protein